MGNNSSRARGYRNDDYRNNDYDADYDDDDAYESTAARSWYKPKRSKSLGGPRGWFSNAFRKEYPYTTSSIPGQYMPYPGMMYSQQYPYMPAAMPQGGYPQMAHSNTAPVIPPMRAPSAARTGTPVIPQNTYSRHTIRTPMPEPHIPEIARSQGISSPVIPPFPGSAGSQSTPVIPRRRGATTPHPGRHRPRSFSTPVHFGEPVIPGGTPMGMPEPQISHGTPSGFPQPVIPPNTPAFPEPERAPPQFAPAPPSSARPPSRLAPGQYGQYDRRHRRAQTMSWVSVLANPLPEPPKDLFESPEYLALIDELRRPLPHADGALRRNYTAPPLSASGRFYSGGSGASREKKRRGLFGSLRFGSRRERERDQDGYAPAYTPVYGGDPVMQRLPDGGTAYVYPPAATPVMPTIPGSPSGMSVPGVVPMLGPEPPRGPSPGPARSTTPSSLRPAVIRVNDHNDYSALLHLAPYAVQYAGARWPTAFHLLEGLKFMDGHPEIAEAIRACRTPEDVRNTSESWGGAARQDWGQVVHQMLDEVLYNKFRQHPALQGMLMNTGGAEIVYAEAADSFLGDGPLGQGANELGKALMRVRERLRAESAMR
ncbi:hypothetical protein CERSUDRAFT_91044 [Gelatoporia subvermispora B]|uniref:NADAR domain-containing protein n=1 Tax=Ceriporiopsis subvermispora (strain B) TaxID=914234 RepID=M2PUB8_CERS8|nr:hypothetical protein CERSUDRAFT_91044 [Gelatoporia subvermispora B]